jgi:hypothetical protein
VLAITYGDQGTGLSVVCPMGAAMPILLDPLNIGAGHAKSATA